jgi:hypothetical protein
VTDGFDAEAAAARALGEAVEEETDSAVAGAAAEGAVDAATSSSSSSSEDVQEATDEEAESLVDVVRSMLMSTSPNPELSDVDDPWNPEEGGTSRIYRAAMKATGVDGLPAVGDAIIGFLEAGEEQDVAGESSSDDDEDDEPELGELAGDVGGV